MTTSAANVKAAGSWKVPTPLFELPKAPPFPLATLPPGLRVFVEAGARALHCPPDYFAVHALALAGQALGHSRTLRVKDGYHERPALYCGVVGPVGSAKSPALAQIAAPLYAEQEAAYNTWQAARSAAPEDDQPTLAPLRTLWVHDATRERLGGILLENPRGVALVQDELSHFFQALNQYKPGGKGTDGQFFCSAWGGEQIHIQRNDPRKPPVLVPRPFLAVTGNVPPRVLKDLRSFLAAGDGLAARFLWSYPEPQPRVGETGATIPTKARHWWNEALRHLRALEPHDGDDKPEPVTLPLEQEAWELWCHFTKQLAAAMEAGGFPEILRGPWSKFFSYLARLALVLQLLWWVDGSAGDGAVSAAVLCQADELVQYFGAHARRVYAVAGCDPTQADAEKVLSWIRRNGNRDYPTFSKRQLFRAMQGTFARAADLDAPLAILVRHNYLRSADRENRVGRPSEWFEVGHFAWDVLEEHE